MVRCGCLARIEGRPPLCAGARTGKAPCALLFSTTGLFPVRLSAEGALVSLLRLLVKGLGCALLIGLVGDGSSKPEIESRMLIIGSTGGEGARGTAVLESSSSSRS